VRRFAASVAFGRRCRLLLGYAETELSRNLTRQLLEGLLKNDIALFYLKIFILERSLHIYQREQVIS
jgi:hypothetical protein